MTGNMNRLTRQEKIILSGILILICGIIAANIEPKFDPDGPIPDGLLQENMYIRGTYRFIAGATLTAVLLGLLLFFRRLFRKQDSD